MTSKCDCPAKTPGPAVPDDFGDLAELSKILSGIGTVLSIIADTPNACLNKEALDVMRWEVERAAAVEENEWSQELLNSIGETPSSPPDTRKAGELLRPFPEPDGAENRNRRECETTSDLGPAGGQAYVPLPQAPQTTSPTPWLTSIHGTPGRGPYGDPSYRGNCSGVLIRDLLCYFRPSSVLDPMTGGGTCSDVCRDLGIPCRSFDLRSGFDATDPKAFDGLGTFQFVWVHPPYWKMIRYGDDPRCLSNAPTVADFVDRLRAVIRHCAGVLTPNGKIAILMGDGKDQGEYLGLPFRTLNAAASEGLWLATPEIIRFGHGSSSSAKAYSTSFIPRLHDVCLILKKSFPDHGVVDDLVKKGKGEGRKSQHVNGPPRGVVLRIGAGQGGPGNGAAA